MVSLWENKHCGEAPFPKLSHWQPYALGTRTLSWFGHGRIGNRMLLEHERYHGLGMDALATVCSWNTNVIMVWAWAHCQPYALGTRTLSWFGHGRIGNRMLLEHERYHGLGVGALATVCSWNTNVIMVWAWAHWQPYALGTRTLSWFGHGRIGNPMLLEHERYHGLGMDALASVCSSCLLCRDPDKMPRCSRAADIPKCAFYQGSLVAHLPKTSPEHLAKLT